MPVKLKRRQRQMIKTTYSNKRNATRNTIDSVFIDNFRSSGVSDLTVKEICERAGINRSTFYTYYKDTVDMREQIEDRLISQLEKRMTTIVDLYLEDPDLFIREIMEYNRENGFLPLLLISSGSSRFLYRVSDAAIEMLSGGHELTDDVREKITMLYTYHFAGMSMLIRRMKENYPPCDDGYEDIAQKLSELIRPIVYNGILPVMKENISISNANLL